MEETLVDRHFTCRLQEGLVAGTLARGWRFELHRFFGGDDVSLRFRIEEMRPDAVVSGTFEAVPAEESFLSSWAKKRPFVLIGPPDVARPAFRNAYVDESAGIRKAVRHLLAEGFPGVDFLGKVRIPRPQLRRFEAVKIALAECGAQPPRFLDLDAWIENPGFLREGLRAVKTMADRSDRRRAKRTNAVLCFNDLYATQLLDLLAKIERRSPEDLALCGFDGVELPSSSGMTLSTLFVDWAQVGEAALRLLEPGCEKRSLLIAPDLRIGTTSLGRSRSLSARKAAFLRTAHAVLEESFREKDCQARAAAACGTGLAAFRRNYLGIEKVLFTRRILEKRLSVAKRLLIEGDEKIAEIGTKAGFHSQVRFFRCFRKSMGMTPLAFRKDHSPRRRAEESGRSDERKISR